MADDEVFAQAKIYRVGDFILQVTTWSGVAALRVVHATEPDRALIRKSRVSRVRLRGRG